MFSAVLNKEHKKLPAKTSKKPKRKKVIVEESASKSSSDSSDKDMSIQHMERNETVETDIDSRYINLSDENRRNRQNGQRQDLFIQD